VIGPILGGVLASAEGWRSTFILLIIVGVIATALIIFTVPETHHWFVVKRLSGDDPAKLDDLIEHEQITSSPPRFMAPWRALALAFAPNISPYVAALVIPFAGLYGALTLLSPALALHPYNLSQSIIGICFIPNGIGCLIASLVGGRISDYAARRYQAPEGRMLLNFIISFAISIPGFLIYLWTLQYGTNLAGPLIGTFFVGLGGMMPYPSIVGYLSGLDPSQSAAAMSASTAMLFISAGVGAEASVYLVQAIGFGQFATVMVGAIIIADTFVIARIVSKIRAFRRQAALSA